MTNGLLVVIPAIMRETTDLCVESILAKDSAAGFSPDELLIVDNSRDGWGNTYGLRTYRDPDGHNLGVARAWNVGACEVLERGLDYLVICSASMRFGPILHTTWRAQIEEFWGARVIEAQTHSWHAIALHRSTFERIGLFDPAFYPAYIEQIDWCYRLRMVGWEQGFVRITFNAMSMGVAMHAPLVSCPAAPLLGHYRSKWGGDKGEERWTLPYGDRPLDHILEDPIPVLAQRYGLGEYGKGWW